MLTIFSLFIIKISLLDSVEAGHEVKIKAYFKDFVDEVPVYANAKANLRKCRGPKYELKDKKVLRAGLLWELTFKNKECLKPDEICSDYQDEIDMELEEHLSNYHKEKFPVDIIYDKTASRKKKIITAEEALDKYIKNKESEKKMLNPNKRCRRTNSVREKQEEKKWSGNEENEKRKKRRRKKGMREEKEQER
ncbi:hypothetical protein niasHS_011621 [Heterodera schachtii]|uniref:Uncharacterized protein n=1 Tax=Heterodera schachtii TaxID=97005 RepID=A0ABD2IER4_HETSC